MHLDVIDLRNFYYRTKLGRSAQRGLQGAMRGLWPDVKGMEVAGFGFAVPVLRPFLGEAQRVLGLMPGQQGVMHWPPGGANLTALVEETMWPLAAGSLDRVVVAHGLETCESPDALLAEIWRVLAPGGKVVFIVPNRSGIWARRDVTPFGFGRPYSVGQLEGYLRLHRFQAERHVICPAKPKAVLAEISPVLGKVGPPDGRPARGRSDIAGSHQAGLCTTKRWAETSGAGTGRDIARAARGEAEASEKRVMGKTNF